MPRIDKLMDAVSDLQSQVAVNSAHILHIRESVELLVENETSNGRRLDGLEQDHARVKGALSATQGYLKVAGLVVAIVGAVEGFAHFLT